MPADLLQEFIGILRYAHKYRRAIVFYIILGIFGIGMGLTGSLASKYFIDIFTGYNSSNLGFFILLITCMALESNLIKANLPNAKKGRRILMIIH
jgi:hypothetical protein